jgi:hypothetical protein
VVILMVVPAVLSVWGDHEWLQSEKPDRQASRRERWTGEDERSARPAAVILLLGLPLPQHCSTSFLIQGQAPRARGTQRSLSHTSGDYTMLLELWEGGSASPLRTSMV